MKLATRMWLTGAVMPVGVMALVLLGATRLFEHALESSLDRALLAQAAVESVSLFDGPGNRPHLHMATSPLVESVRPFAPQGALYGPDGRLVMRYPPELEPLEHAHERLVPHAPIAQPQLSTQQVSSRARERVLLVSVASPQGDLYALELVASLTQLDAANATFRSLSALALAATALVLLLAQALQARRLQRRLAQLTRHAAALREGELEHTLASESERDELAELRDVLGNATSSLRAARDVRDRFIADAAHELRTPLTLMRTNLDLALRRERTRDELKLTLHELREEVIRLSELSARLLDLAAIPRQAGERALTNLSVIVSQAVDGIRAHAAERGCRVELASPAREIRVRVDGPAIRGALDNLLSNAVKYGKSEVQIRVEVERELVRVRICDDGPGIPEAERELVFEPFHRARGGQPGAGLGLAIVRATARAHGGRAYVADSAHGAQLVFELSEPESSSEHEPDLTNARES